LDHYENFPVASVLLPPRMRRAVASIYRFARSADDFADEGHHPPQWRLAQLRGFRDALDRLAAGGAPGGDPLFDALGHAIAEHGLPLGPFYALLSAFEQDVVKGRYASFEELLDYCARSANPIGRLLLALSGIADDESGRRSDAVCTALQLTNFWQDVRIDWSKDRVYIPLEDLARFAVAESDIEAQRVSQAFAACMQFQVQRTRNMMLAGAPLARRIGGRFGWELRLVVEGGLRILEKIERSGFDVFRSRPQLKSVDWVVMIARSVARPPARPSGSGL
jgi:squalene synthase HpnC